VTTRRLIVAAVSLLGIALVACEPIKPPASPARPVYPYTPSPLSGPASPTTCRTVLVIGDSLAFEASEELQAQYDQHGYCLTLTKGATYGGNTMVDANGNPQSPRLTNFLAADPDAVVFAFVGNVEPPQVAAAETAYLGLIDQVAAVDIPVFVTSPPVSIGSCNPAGAWTLGHKEFRTWVMANLPGTRPVVRARWSEVLTPGGTQETFNDSLQFAAGVQPVRTPDCLHFTQRGKQVAAQEIVAATQPLWTSTP
jgi:hypothetical protein